jgi:RNA polymerase sigma-70 factor (ECF subfamily)
MSATRDLTALLEQTGWIHDLARKLVADPHLAADLAQETCVQALERAPTAERPLRAWLATVLRRQLARVRRGNASRAQREALQRAEDAPDTAEVVERAETHKHVVLAVLALAEPYRSTLLLRFFEQLSYDEIARRTGVTSAAVNSRVTRGLAELRARLETTYGGDRRALGLALAPLAKLPTTGLALTTATGWKTMTFWIGSAAAGLIVTTLTVTTFGGGGRGAGAPPSEPVVKEELELPLELVLEGAAERVAAPLTLPGPQDKRDKTRAAPWESRLAHTLALAPSVVAFEVNSGAGDVEVRPSNSGRVEIDARVVARLDKVKPERLTQVFEDHVEVSETKGVLRIKDRHDNEEGWSVHLVVAVPKALPVHANSGAGDVLVAAGGAKVQANSGAGEVRVELAEARLAFLKANSGAGDVAVAVGAVSDELELNSGAGAVTLLVADPVSPGKADLNSGAGNVRLLVPANWIGELDLETMSTIELPPSFGLQIERDIAGRSSVRGALGIGGGRYKLRSGAGSLGVEIGHALPERKPKKP